MGKRETCQCFFSHFIEFEKHFFFVKENGTWKFKKYRKDCRSVDAAPASIDASMDSALTELFIPYTLFSTAAIAREVGEDCN